jgi:ATP-binding cassette subfamily G (WHITE) protein 5 (sterolin 1)
MDQLHSLELLSVSHSGPIVPVHKQSLWSRVTGGAAKGLILKDVTMQLSSGQLMAVLGSKGSGKRALLEVIAHRSSSDSATKGQILLNEVPLTARLFQEQCGFVCRRTPLLQGLSVRQHLHYMAMMSLRTSASVRRARVKQVLNDLALVPVASRHPDQLGESEQKRLAIALQLVRDPLLLLLDEPTAGLDPLHAYLVLSMLSAHAKRFGRLVLFTLDTPRSDLCPFLDRVTYLCLGDVVYSGATSAMLDYFRSIGFPCPVRGPFLNSLKLIR